MSETILFPSRGPRPAPSVAPPAAAAQGRLRLPGLRTLALGLAASALLGVGVALALHARQGRAEPEGVALGRAFVHPLAEALAEGFEAHAAAFEAGKSAGEADEALKAAFHHARARAFANHAAGAFARLVPSGSEPKDDATRNAFATLHRDFARGLRQR